MEEIAFSGADKAARYRELVPQLAALFDGEPDLVANLAVLDLDSYEPAAFDDNDAAGLAPVAELLAKLAW